MTKKIEISTTQANIFIGEKLAQFTNNNTTNANGSCQLYLMSGDVPWDENGFFPKEFSIQTNGNNNITSLTSGTYTASLTYAGQTIVASVLVENNTTSNFQIISRSGNKGFGITDTVTWPFEIPGTYSWGVSTVVGVDVFPSINGTYILDFGAGGDDSNILVRWKNNRIKSQRDNSGVRLYTYASAARTSGTATWFYGVNMNSISNGRMYFAGTVGLTGSGADLELDDVNIVQGKTYGISNLRIQVPTSFTY